MKNKLLILVIAGIFIPNILYGCSDPNTSKTSNTNSLTISETSNKESINSSNEEITHLSKIGALAAKEDNTLTKEKMLIYSIQDEYFAKKEYELIMDKYGSQKPFSNIIEAEKNHISQLTELFNTYKINIPEDNSKDYAVLPNSLDDAYKAGVTAEIDNIAMYDRFLKEDLPQDIKDTFVALRDASKKHLAAFQNKID